MSAAAIAWVLCAALALAVAGLLIRVGSEVCARIYEQGRADKADEVRREAQTERDIAVAAEQEARRQLEAVNARLYRVQRAEAGWTDLLDAAAEERDRDVFRFAPPPHVPVIPGDSDDLPEANPDDILDVLAEAIGYLREDPPC